MIEANILWGVIVVLVIIIGVLLHRRYRDGYIWTIRSFINAHKLKQDLITTPVPPEALRQLFLVDYPEYQDKDTAIFIKNVGKYLHYVEPNEDFDEGCFMCNAESDLLRMPEPTNEFAPLPKGFENIQ